jgi:WD40 repeat protein
MMKDTMNIDKWLIRSTAFFGIILLTACSLPMITPLVETIQSTPTTFVVSTGVNPTPTAVPTSAPVEITTKNATGLTVINRSPINNPQQLKWAADGTSLSVSTQNTDSSGAQLFGLTVLRVPDLAPSDIFSTQTDRVADISSDGKEVVLVSLDQTKFSVIDSSQNNTLLLSVTPDYQVNNVTFSPDGKMLAVSKLGALEVELYSAVDGSDIRTLSGFDTAAPVYQAGFKESPQWMVWQSRATLQLQEIESGTFESPLNSQDFVMAYALTNDGTMVATLATKQVGDATVPAISLWDSEEGTELRTLVLASPAQCLAFSPKGTMLAVGVGNTLQIWDVTSGNLIVSLEGHAGLINNVAFSPDGKYVATTGQDDQLYLWQVSK